MRNKKLIPFEVIEKAVAGEPEAIDAVLRHYSGNKGRGKGFYYHPKNEVLLCNITNDIFILPFPFRSFPFRRLCRFALPKRRGVRERIGREWVFD